MLLSCGGLFTFRYQTVPFNYRLYRSLEINVWDTVSVGLGLYLFCGSGDEDHKQNNAKYWCQSEVQFTEVKQQF